YIPQHYYSRSCLDPSFFFFHATSTLDTYPFSLPDALPISRGSRCGWRSATSRISERSSGRRNAASPPLSAVPPDASSRARSSRTGSRPSPSSPPPTPTGSTPTCEHPAYTDQLTGPIGLDVGKTAHHACALDPDGNKLFDKALPQDETKLRELFTQLQNHGEVLMVVDQPNTIGALPIAVARDSGCSV